MRIISGKYRGKSIVPGKEFTARPTTDFAKEGLMNILVNRWDLETVHVLDLFSGTGSISFEFISRGAVSVDAVEMDMRHAMFITKTGRSLNMNSLRVVHHDVAHFLRICKKQYNLVFADPPYDLKWLSELPDKVLSSGVLAPGGCFVLEHPRGVEFKEHPAFEQHRNYGNVHFSFFNHPTL